MKTLIISVILIISFPLFANEMNYENTQEYVDLTSTRKERASNKYNPSFNIASPKNLREEKSIGINAGVGGPVLLGLTLDYFITEDFNIELSLVMGYMPLVIGAKYFFTPEDNASMYIGIHGTYKTAYFPIGFQYMNDNDFTFAIEAGAIIMPELDICVDSCEEKDRNKPIRVYPWGGVKIGYHFK